MKYRFWCVVIVFRPGQIDIEIAIDIMTQFGVHLDEVMLGSRFFEDFFYLFFWGCMMASGMFHVAFRLYFQKKSTFNVKLAKPNNLRN